jgi:YggT family protein
VRSIICLALQIYFLILLLRIVLSWFPVASGGAMASIQGVLFSVTEPILAPLRAILPPVRMGAVGLDLSPMVLFLGIVVLQRIIC